MPIDLTDTKFLYIIFPYPAGGNHLCNLLSTHEYFYKRFSSDNYYDDLLASYKKKILLDPNLENFAKSNNNIGVPDKEENIFKSLGRIYNAHVWNGNPTEEVNLIEIGNYTDITIIHKVVKFHISIPTVELENLKLTKKIICQCHELEDSFINFPKSKHKLLKELYYSLQFQKFMSGIVMTYPKEKGRAYKRLQIANSDLSKDVKQNYNLPIKVRGIEFFNSNNAIELNTDLFCEDDGSKYLQDLIAEKFNILLSNNIHELHKLWIEMVDKSIAIAESK